MWSTSQVGGNVLNIFNVNVFNDNGNVFWAQPWGAAARCRSPGGLWSLVLCVSVSVGTVTVTFGEGSFVELYRLCALTRSSQEEGLQFARFRSPFLWGMCTLHGPRSSGAHAWSRSLSLCTVSQPGSWQGSVLGGGPALWASRCPLDQRGLPSLARGDGVPVSQSAMSTARWHTHGAVTSW